MSSHLCTPPVRPFSGIGSFYFFTALRCLSHLELWLVEESLWRLSFSLGFVLQDDLLTGVLSMTP